MLLHLVFLFLSLPLSLALSLSLHSFSPPSFSISLSLSFPFLLLHHWQQPYCRIIDAKCLAVLAYVPSGSNGKDAEKLKGTHSSSNVISHFPHLQLLLPQGKFLYTVYANILLRKIYLNFLFNFQNKTSPFTFQNKTAHQLRSIYELHNEWSS